MFVNKLNIAHFLKTLFGLELANARLINQPDARVINC